MSAPSRQIRTATLRAAAVARGRQIELAERRQSTMQANAQLHALHY